MNKHEAVFLVGLMVLSALTSFFLVMYGMSIVMAGSLAGKMLFAYITIAYGLGNIAILSIAWSSRNAWAGNINMFLAISYLGVFAVDALNAGMGGGIGLFVIALLAAVLYMNWFTVKKVVGRA